MVEAEVVIAAVSTDSITLRKLELMVVVIKEQKNTLLSFQGKTELPMILSGVSVAIKLNFFNQCLHQQETKTTGKKYT